MGQSDYYTIREIAERMGVSKMTLYRMASRGQLPGAVAFGPRTVRVHKVTFDLWLDEQQAPAVAASDPPVALPAEPLPAPPEPAAPADGGEGQGDGGEGGDPPPPPAETKNAPAKKKRRSPYWGI